MVIYKNIQKNKPEFPPSLGPAAVDIMRKLMTSDNRRRLGCSRKGTVRGASRMGTAASAGPLRASDSGAAELSPRR